MQLHPICELFREQTPDEYAAMRDSMSRVGQQLPGLTHEGLLVDGRHRLKACRELGIPFKHQPLDLKPGQSLVEVVAAYNVGRRHYSQSELAMVGVAMAAMMVGEGVSNKDAKQRAANSLGVDESYIRRAQMVATHRPDLAEKVKRGELTLTKAAEQVSEKLAEKGREDAQLYDKVGRELTLPKLKDAFVSGHEMDAIFHEFSALKTRVKMTKGYPCNSRVGMEQVLKLLDDARKLLFLPQPYAVCVYCGVGKPSCEECGGFGWMTKRAWDLASPELKGKA